MASQTNKVRFGLSRVHYALFDEDTQTYGEVKPLAGAVNISFEPQGSQNQFYADNVIYFTSNPAASDTGSLEIADMTDQALIDLLGYVRDSVTGVLYEPTTARHPTFALLYQQEGDGNTKRGVRYNVTLNRPSESAATTTDSVDPNTQTLDYTAAGRDFTIDGEPVNILKAQCTDAGDEHDAYDAWFESVVIPGTAVGTTGVATLSALTVGTLTLAPTFAAGTNTYTATTTDSTNVVTATPTDSDATVVITCNGNAVTNGEAATWSAGANYLSVVVTNGDVVNAYTVVVTKS